MSSGFEYTQQQPTKTIRNFPHLRTITLWAAILGVIQAIIWIILAMFGIFHYNCLIPIDDKVTYGSIVSFVFFELYFHGDCKPDVYASVNYDVLNTVDTILSPSVILIWTSIYLAIMIFWLASSILLIKYLEREDINLTCFNLYVWSGITLVICIQDLVLGILFAIDYGRFSAGAYNYNLATYEAGAIIPDAVQLIAGQISAACMMIISFKGFILWIVNCALMIYLLMQVMSINGVINGDDEVNYNNEANQNEREENRSQSPIRAYSDPPKKFAVYSNDGFVPEGRPIITPGSLEINQDPVARAARIAMDTCLQDRRFRNIESYQQYPLPDYTPPMRMRRGISPQNNEQSRNSRY